MCVMNVENMRAREKKTLLEIIFRREKTNEIRGTYAQEQIFGEKKNRECKKWFFEIVSKLEKEYWKYS